MRKFRPYLWIIWIIPFLSVAQDNLRERQELRLTKAQLALVDGNLARAHKLLKKNLMDNPPHKESYFWLVDLHWEKGDFTKAFKTYHHLLARLHVPDITQLVVDERFEAHLGSLPKASVEAQEIYWRVAEEYKRLYQQKLDFWSSQGLSRLLALSRKYYRVCKYYGYQPMDASIRMAEIDGLLGDNQKVVEGLLELKEKYNDMDEAKRKPGTVHHADFLLGEALVKTGNIGAGGVFLKDVHTKASSSDPLKEYAGIYLEGLSDVSLLSVSFSGGLTYNDNIHSLSTVEKQNYTPSTSAPESDKGTLLSKTLSVFYLGPKKNHRSWTFGLTGQELTTQNENQDIRNSRSLYASAALTWDDFEKSLWKFTAQYTWLAQPMEAGGSYKTILSSQSFTPQYQWTGQRGLASISVPITYEKSTGEQLFHAGLGLSYTPYRQSRWLSPTFSATATSYDEGEGDKASQRYKIGVSNHVAYSSQDSIFMSAGHTRNRNEDRELIYNEVDIALVWSRTFNFFKGLSFSATGTRYWRTERSDERIRTNTLEGELTYSF